MDTPFAYGFRRRENRVLIDNKHIIPNVSKDAAKPVFDIICVECPYNDFGINSDLGLAISKQIIKGNEDNIWAGKIRSTLTFASSGTPGANFIVCLSF